MGKIRLVAVLVAALALALALAGCGGGASSSSSASASSSSSAAGSSASASSSSRATASVRINTDGMGVIAWAYEGEEPEFDDDKPYQSAVVNDAYGQTIRIEARDYGEYEGWHFVKWTKDGADFSTDNRIDVAVDGDAEYIAVFDFADE